MSRQDDILSFWFAGIDLQKPIPPERSQLWFGGAPETDELIRTNFLADVEQAAAGSYDSWACNPQGALALVLLLDQFPRNIYRNSPKAFATDAKALSVSLDGIDAGQDVHLTFVERAFFYLPLEHSEVLEVQKKSVTLFQALAVEASPVHRASCESFYDYAVRHHDIIARFGRFPHRNRILGRESTPEEDAFLKQPGSSF